MRNYGVVKAIDGRHAEVAVPKSGECQRCGACIVAASDHISLVRALNQAQARVGDRVEIEIDPKVAVKAAFLVFIFPLIFAGLFGTIAYQIAKTSGHSYLIAAVFGALGLLSAFAFLGLTGKRRAGKVYAVVVGIVEQSKQGGDISSGR